MFLTVAFMYLSIGIFEVNDDNGEIYALANIDREVTSSYTLDVMVSDKDPIEPRQNYTQVQIIISDVNDNQPRFYKDLWSLRIQENLPINSEITRVRF